MAAAAGHQYNTLRWWLVDQPAIRSFRWLEYRTLGASPFFLSATVAAYLSLTFLLHRRLLPFPRPSPPLIRALSSLHNVFLLFLSLAMAVGCSLSALAQMPSPRWLLCFPKGATPEGPVFFWAQVFYLSKIYEFIDTLLIILGSGGSGGGGSSRRLSFLHVYHHAVVVVMCYVWLATAQSLVPVALVTNASVHVVMYGYYLSTSLGWKWPPAWKRAVTNTQIVQFVFSFIVSLGFLWFHFAGAGCSGMNGWLFNAVFNASLLALFLDFHSKNYARGSGRRMKVVDGKNKTG